ncbi:MAG: hypothetical protein US69_C0021G0008 [candidate division TM6 bacterium GW2011_GWF2_38_10]|nr:MAG: hypothetical protein US69_C0021G0008 [candidate division TM6 bacterium GW2011_GWF2_38_10]
MKQSQRLLISGLLTPLALISYHPLQAQKKTPKQPPAKYTSFFSLAGNDAHLKLNGRLKDDFMFFNNAQTLRNDYSDQRNLVRHRLDINAELEQGRKKYGSPATEAQFKLTNYVYWQKHNNYTPFMRQNLRTSDFDQTIVAENVTAKTLMPLIFVEQAWFKLHLDKCINSLKKYPTFLQVGYFKYMVGRGVSLGYHDDLAVDYLGWPGEDRHTRYPHMPPGVLLRMELAKNLSVDAYWMKWTSVGTDLEDTLAPARAQFLNTGPARGVNKDRSNYVLKLDYTPEYNDFGKLHLQPYVVHTRAPEQSIEFEADASAHLTTLGAMIDCKRGNFHVNVELAGQFGHQTLHPIDRNIKELKNGSATFSHIVYEASNGTVHVPVRDLNISKNAIFNPGDDDLSYLVNMPHNRTLSMQGQAIKIANGTALLKILPNSGTSSGGTHYIYNANSFGNARFRPGYRLNYQGFMALADISYTPQTIPYKFTGAAGYISGDNYPYNEESSRTYYGFVPMRSRYTGFSMDNYMIFDRLVIPRPLNISHRTLFAFNNTKDLSNLQFLGVGATWYPLANKQKCQCTTNVWALWEVAQLQQWDSYGKHPDAAIEKEIAYERARLGFPGVNPKYDGNSTVDNKGWLSSKKASRMLGLEVDMRATYSFFENAHGYALLCLFLPRQLYKDLEGQPNIRTRRLDEKGLTHYDSLGSEPAFAASLGLNYKF